MSLKHQLRQVIQKLGYDVTRYHKPHKLDACVHLLKHYQITVVLDVGANIGQTGKHLREAGYTGRIISFEPVAEAFRELRDAAQHDPGWTCVNCALGDHPHTANIRVAECTVTTSFLPVRADIIEMLPIPRTAYEEQVAVNTVDAMIGDLTSPADRVFLKIDTQGYEPMVLRGAERTLQQDILGIQLEMSLTPVYEGQQTICEIIDYTSDRGYSLVSIAPAFRDPKTGQIMEVDGIFFRRDIIERRKHGPL